MQTVCCATFGPPENLRRIDTAIPTAGAGEVLVDVRAAGVGFVDGLMIQGLYQVKPALPYYPGSEFAGVVSALGAGVEQFAVGDRVMGLAGSGAYSDYVAVSARGLVKLSDSLDDATAAGFYINYATALYGLRDCGRLQSRETLLILGAAGGVGSAAICVAKAIGAEVIAAASTPAKRAAALSFGADAVVDYSRDDWRGESRANPKINVELMETLFGLLEERIMTCAPVTQRPMQDVVAALAEQLAGQVIGKLVLVNA